MAEDTIITVIISIIAVSATAIGSMAIQERRLRKELQTEFMAEKLVRKLLSNKEWKTRSFEEIGKKIGGFEEDELRKLLIRAGAVRFYKKDKTKKELWGLLSRNKDKLNE